METLVVFIILAFALAAVIIMKKEAIPDRLRRPLAIVTLFLIVSAFVFLMLSFFGLGEMQN